MTPQQDVLARASDLGYEGKTLYEAVVILCCEGYDEDRAPISGDETACLLSRWIVRMDDDGATVQTFADSDRARAYFDAAIRKEVKC